MSLRRLETVGFSVLLLGLTACSGAVKVVGDEPLSDTGGSGGDTTSPFDTGSGGDDSGGSDSPTISISTLTLDPPNTTVFIDTSVTPVVPGTLTYKAILTDEKGVTTDVTASAAFSLTDPYGTFTGATFSSVTDLPAGALGATTTIKALADGKNAEAKLTLVKIRKTADPATGRRDFFFTVPYEQDPDPKTDVLKFSTKIQKVDVAIVMDSTGSMSGSISNLQRSLSTTIFPALAAAIPNVGLAVVDHKDYPVCGHGGGGDFPAKVYQVITTDLKAAQTATTRYGASGGADGPESQIPAMWHTLTGGALNWSGGSLPAHKPPAGTFGGVDFRPGAVPVVVLITDVSWHDAKKDPYCGSVTGAPSLETLKAEFNKVNAKFVDVTSSDESQANELSDATKSSVPTTAFLSKCGAGKCCTGISGAAATPTGPGGTCRLNFRHSGGTGVSDSIVNAISAISVGSIYDITAKLSNDPTNADGVDATKFIKALRAKGEGDAAEGCPAAKTKDSNGDGIDDTFVSVTVGTPVCFEVIPERNTTVPPKEVAQFFNAKINMVGVPGDIDLGDQRVVVFLVPPKGPVIIK